MIKKLNKNAMWIFCLLFSPLANFAQETTSASIGSNFSNALFNTLFFIIIILLIVLIVLGNALKNIVQGDYMQNKFKKNDEAKTNDNITKTTSVFLLLFTAFNCAAQSATPSQSQDWLIGGLDMFTVYFMLFIILIELIIIVIFYTTIMGFLKSEKLVSPNAKPKINTILKKLNASVDIEKEGDITLDHNYDGIIELDNDLPPWWKFGFYITVVVGIIYLINYHVLGTGDLQNTEYENSMREAKIEVDAYMKTAANNVDETTVTQLEGADLTAGQDLFIANCAACHGKVGQGTVGPNLTDAYWLHGGGLSDVFKSIKYGWVDKGMKSWKEDFSPIQISQISSFVRTLQGTHPADGKATQGDLYTEGIINVTDSLKIKGDSLTIVTDSLSIQKDTIH